MRRSVTYLITAFFCVNIIFAQIHVVAPVKPIPTKKFSNFGIGLGLTRSVVYLPRNTQNNNDAMGRSLLLSYDHGNVMRFTFEYNKYQSLDFSPTWYNVKASCFESNVMFIARFNDDHSYFYPILGVSYNLFTGYFTGINDYLSLRSVYQESTTVSSNWIGFNAGAGFDYNFKHSAIYLTYKMRAGHTEGNSRYSIQDICFTAGYRVFVSGPQLKKLFRGTRSRYVLSKPKKKE